jgi:hypothetical protein
MVGDGDCSKKLSTLCIIHPLKLLLIPFQNNLRSWVVCCKTGFDWRTKFTDGCCRARVVMLSS